MGKITITFNTACAEVSMLHIALNPIRPDIYKCFWVLACDGVIPTNLYQHLILINFSKASSVVIFVSLHKLKHELLDVKAQIDVDKI